MNKRSYSVQHLTEFFYSSPVWESIFLLSMRPLRDKRQNLSGHNLTVSPKAKVFAYSDQYGNTRQIFNILKAHRSLKIHSSFRVEVTAPDPPSDHTRKMDWGELKRAGFSREMWNWLQPGHFTRVSGPLKKFLREEGIEKPSDPLSGLKSLNAKLFSVFDYSPKSTQARSPIEEILTSKKGVCQDYSHVMITIARLWGVPSRYVSGYLYDSGEGHTASLSHESHAWCECYLPPLGWLGFDPANNTMAGVRHIKTAVGRDYEDVPPHKGFFKGGKTERLKVSVTVQQNSVLL